MNVNDMVAAMAAKTVDAMVNVEPYNAIAEADGIGTTLVNFMDVDPLPVFMAATPDFVEKQPGHRRRLSEGLARRRGGFQEATRQGRRRDLHVLHVQGLQDEPRHLQEGAGRGRGEPGLPATSSPTCSTMRESLLKEKKIKAIPDWKQGAADRLHGQGHAPAPDRDIRQPRKIARGRRLHAGPVCIWGPPLTCGNALNVLPRGLRSACREREL